MDAFLLSIICAAERIELVTHDRLERVVGAAVPPRPGQRDVAQRRDTEPEAVRRVERDALAAIPYQSNEVVLHTDESLLPRHRAAWSSWNYWLRERHQQRAVLNYNMNILQGLKSDTTFCVTLNASESISPDKIIDSFDYSHLVFSLESVAAAQKIQDFNGLNRTWFAGRTATATKITPAVAAANLFHPLVIFDLDG